MFEDFLNHRCDIYHLETKQQSAGYGIKTGTVMRYGSTPSVTDVHCHFHVKSDVIRIEQNEPYPALSGEGKLTLPIGTDIRKNDKVRNRETGECFICDRPTKIQDHHITVKIKAESGLKGAI